MSFSNPIVFSDIDDYLHRLTQQVGGSENETFFKNIMLSGISDHASFLKPYLSWSELVKERWSKYKISNPSETDIVHGYEEKLKLCDAYLELLKSILDEDKSKKEQIESLLKPKIKIFLRIMC